MCLGMGGGEEQGRSSVLQEKRRQLICRGGFGATCEPLCCISEILFFSAEWIVRILFRH